MHHSVLFICLGNICRSPLAEGIFRHLVTEAGLSTSFLIDSCGTGDYHIGNSPHRDSIRVAKKNGICIKEQRARQVQADDFQKFEYLVAMDSQNKKDLVRIGRGSGTILTLREFDPIPDSPDVPDPYFGGPEGFDEVYKIIHRSCVALLEDIVSK